MSGRAADPVVQTIFTADPAPMVDKGILYLYTSHDEDDAEGFLMRDWRCFTTMDMVNWTDHGVVASIKNFSWAGSDNGAWAPQCIARNGKYYLYCPLPGRGIGVLVSDSPFGPFTDSLGKPLIGGQYNSIDPTVYIDGDGQAYLYWGNPNLWYVKLNEDMISYSGGPIKDQSFAKVAGQDDPFHYQEGPWFYKRGGHYYMAYASTCCPEGMGYAMSDNATGPWTYKGYIMKPDKRSSGNHPGIIDYKDNSYVFGFNYKLNSFLTNKHRERRSVCVEKFDYNPDGTIPEVPWWDDGPNVTQLEPLDPYTRTEAETICWSSGIKTEPCSEGGIDVYPTRDGAYIKVKGVNFGEEGASAFTVAVACDTKARAALGNAIELHVDDLAGPLLGMLPVPNTAGAWKKESTAVSGATGTHDLFLILKGDCANSHFKFDCWNFTKKPTRKTEKGTGMGQSS